MDLSRDLRLAILEFAPGAEVVAANHLWRSVGLRCPPGRELPVWAWGICEGCGMLRTQLRPPDSSSEEEFTSPCEYCSSELFVVGRRGRFIIPSFGFVGEHAVKEPGETRPQRVGVLETYFAEYDGAPPPVEEQSLGGHVIRWRASRRGWITVFNRGRSSRGFSYCYWCGYGSEQLPKRRRSGGDTPKHPNPAMPGKDCAGSLRPVDLGHRFMTNVLELDLPMGFPESAKAVSTLNALLAALPKLGISHQDVGGSLSVGPSGGQTLMLYDEVPGVPATPVSSRVGYPP